MDKDLVAIFEKANKRFVKENKEFILSDVSERSLCSALAQYIFLELKSTKYSKYYVDVEYNRNKGNVKTIINDNFRVVSIVCDLIVHSRGERPFKDNLIAIEMKKAYRSKQDKENDKARLIALTKESYDGVWSFDGKTLPEHVCGYSLGVYYEIDPRHKEFYIEYYEKGTLQNTYKNSI